MSVTHLPPGELRPRLAQTSDPHLNSERRRIVGRTRGGARELFAYLQPLLLASRPIIGDRKPRPGADGISTPREPIYGAPTFRNVLGEIR